MLRLSREQHEQLEGIVLMRHAVSISSVLAQAWPTMTELLQERWPAFVEAAVQQGRRHGLVDARDLARYASLWCIWGPSFDARPAFAWAAEILADGRRSSALKLHQLIHRSRDELARRGPAVAGAAPAMTAEQFDAALARVEAQAGQLATARSVFLVEAAPPLVKACDIGSIDMMVAEAENLQEYRHGANGWQRLSAGRANDPHVTWSRAPEAPVELALTSHALRGGAPARLNLRVDAQAVCDPRVHPEIVHIGSEGRLAWKGRDASRLSLALYSPPRPLPAAGAPLPGIGAASAFDAQSVRLASCGLRDAGAPFGEVELALRVYPATQWLCEVRHPAWPPMIWPAGHEATGQAPSTACTLAADGVAVDAAAWQQSWAGLHAAFIKGMERLYNEWLRAVDGASARLEVEASPLVGQAGVTWGWKRTAPASVAMRVEGALDLLALSLELRLSGDLLDGPARSRIRVHCSGRSELRMSVAQLGAVATEGQDLPSARRQWRYPFTLEIEPLAGLEPATLGASTGPMPITGALVGESGLRPRADAAGQQWFFSLRCEPVTIATALADPLLGTTRTIRTIFAAMPLVDWSAG